MNWKACEKIGTAEVFKAWPFNIGQKLTQNLLYKYKKN